jgi:general stress protein 26
MTRTTTIATVREDGYPQARTVSNVNDGLKIYFGCAAHSQKARNLARNNKISLTVNPAIRELERHSWSVARRQSRACF